MSNEILGQPRFRVPKRQAVRLRRFGALGQRHAAAIVGAVALGLDALLFARNADEMQALFRNLLARPRCRRAPASARCWRGSSRRTVGAIATLGMIGYFVGVVRSPLTAVLIVSEMTDTRTMLIPWSRPPSSPTRLQRWSAGSGSITGCRRRSVSPDAQRRRPNKSGASATTKPPPDETFLVRSEMIQILPEFTRSTQTSVFRFPQRVVFDLLDLVLEL